MTGGGTYTRPLKITRLASLTQIRYGLVCATVSTVLKQLRNHCELIEKLTGLYEKLLYFSIVLMYYKCYCRVKGLEKLNVGVFS